MRPQVVYRSSNKKYFELIEEFGKISGVYAFLIPLLTYMVIP